MARSYNKIDYMNIDPWSLTKEQLFDVYYNMAATFNARVKSSPSTAGYETSQFWLNAQRFLRYHKRLQTSNGTLTRGRHLKNPKGGKQKEMTLEQVRTYVGELADILAITPTAKQEAKQMSKDKSNFAKAFNKLRVEDTKRYNKLRLDRVRKGNWTESGNYHETVGEALDYEEEHERTVDEWYKILKEEADKIDESKYSNESADDIINKLKDK